MKSTLIYNYNLENPIVYSINNKIFIKDNYDIYLLEKTNKKKIYYEISLIDNSYNKIIKTKRNDLFLKYKNNIYILEKINMNRIKSNEVLKDYKNVKIIKKNNWKELWINKVNEIEKIRITDNDIIELNSYYMGLAESAISFLNNDKDKIEEKQNSICRIRINDKDYRNNNNIIIDYKERDYAEYIKYLFFSNKEKEATDFLKKIDLKKYNKELIFSRLLFPTYYYDIVENIVLSNNKQKEQIEIIKKNIKKYELFLFKSSELLFSKQVIEWIKKNRNY